MRKRLLRTSVMWYGRDYKNTYSPPLKVRLIMDPARESAALQLVSQGIGQLAAYWKDVIEAAIRDKVKKVRRRLIVLESEHKTKYQDLERSLQENRKATEEVHTMLESLRERVEQNAIRADQNATKAGQDIAKTNQNIERILAHFNIMVSDIRRPPGEAPTAADAAKQLAAITTFSRQQVFVSRLLTDFGAAYLGSVIDELAPSLLFRLVSLLMHDDGLVLRQALPDVHNPAAKQAVIRAALELGMNLEA